MELIVCTDDFEGPLTISLVRTTHTPTTVEISVLERGKAPSDHPSDFLWKNQKCLVNGLPLDFQEFLCQQADTLVIQDRKTNSGKYQLEGTHSGSSAHLITFDEGELVVGGIDIEKMTVKVNFTVVCKNVRVVSKFQLHNTGESIQFEPIDDLVGGKRVEIDIVHVYKSPPEPSP